MELEFAKMHGLGNDFVVLDGLHAPLEPDAALIRVLADRRRGIGCDQVLLLQPGPDGAGAIRYRIFNPDGTEVEQCGNGARCVADFLRRRGYVTGNEVTLVTRGGTTRVWFDAPDRIRVNLGVPEFEPRAIPLDRPSRSNLYRQHAAGRELEFAALALGNPHAVLKVDDVDAVDLDEIAGALQRSGAFPQGVNVGVMQVVDPGCVRLRVCERGVGETLACGSGACAAVIAGRLNHGLAADVTVRLRGGELRVNWQGEGQPVWMTGPATTVFEGKISL
jgi:diaminopimelate epimerase